jgi:hypothetical protein
VRPKFSVGAAVLYPYTPLRRRVVLATIKREQKTEQHPRDRRVTTARPYALIQTNEGLTSHAASPKKLQGIQQNASAQRELP